MNAKYKHQFQEQVVCTYGLITLLSFKYFYDLKTRKKQIRNICITNWNQYINMTFRCHYYVPENNLCFMISSFNFCLDGEAQVGVERLVLIYWHRAQWGEGIEQDHASLKNHAAQLRKKKSGHFQVFHCACNLLLLKECI